MIFYKSVSFGGIKVDVGTICTNIIMAKCTEMELPIGGAPHGVAVVDADVFSLLDVDGGPYDDPVVPVEVFAGVVDAGVLQDGDVGVQSLCWSWSCGDLSGTRRRRE